MMVTAHVPTVLVATMVWAMAWFAASATPPATHEDGPPYAHTGCVAEPRSEEEVSALAAQFGGTPGSETPMIFIAEIPSGPTADAKSVDAITHAVLEIAACVRSGELLRLYSLYTDAYLGSILRDTAELPVISPTNAARSGPENQDVRVSAICQVTLLDDGRVSAIVIVEGIEDSHPAPGRTFLMIFREEHGRWFLDGQYEKVWAGTPATAPFDIADLVKPCDHAGATTPEP